MELVDYVGVIGLCAYTHTHTNTLLDFHLWYFGGTFDPYSYGFSFVRTAMKLSIICIYAMKSKFSRLELNEKVIISFH